jgi:hypothetical protein
MQSNNPFDTRKTLTTDSGDVEIYSLKALDEKAEGDVFSAVLRAGTARVASKELRR